MNWKVFYQNALPHAIVLIIFVVLSFLYFSPVLTGKDLPQHDMTMAKGMSNELQQYFEKTGEHALWTNSMFGGMPSYQIRGGQTNNIFSQLFKFIRLGLPYNHVAILFIYMLGFYFFLVVMGVNHWLSFLGSIAFAFGSYNLIIIMAGHVTKAYAIGFGAPVLAGFLLTYKGKYLIGGVITMVALGLQMAVNHYQITYYLAILVLIFVIFHLIISIQNKDYKKFIIASVVSLFAVVLSVVPSAVTLWTTYEYGKESTRGPSELTDNVLIKTKGLDKDYILNDYSYGIDETFTLLIPNFKGGASGGELSKNSEMYQTLKANNVNGAEQIIKQLPLYWGQQRFTAGPVYLGAIVIFLFVLGLYVVKGWMKWWLVAGVVLTLFLAWGKNFYWFSDLFINYFPGYDKFRTVSMILVVTSLCVPLLGFWALNLIVKGDITKEKTKKYLLNSLYITGGLLLLVLLFGSALGDFSSRSDEGIPAVFVEALKLDRISLLKSDAFRSLGYIVLAFSLIWIFIIDKLKLQYFLSALALLILVDQWTICKRYLSNDNFVSKQKAEISFQPSQADQLILQDTSIYRVMSYTTDIFNDASPSYFHKSVGGYHGAKLKRYQELIERHISRQNMSVFNMLNTKYFIVPDKNNQIPQVQVNPDALGNAWFVKGYRLVSNADAEIAALSNFSPADTAIIDERFLDQISGFSSSWDSTANIRLEIYRPDWLTYSYTASTPQLAVFSEIYYNKGWNAYIDGKKTDHFRTNYVLRGMVVPEGQHTIDFKFEPESYYMGQKVAMAGSGLVILLILISIVYSIFFENKNKQ